MLVESTGHTLRERAIDFFDQRQRQRGRLKSRAALALAETIKGPALLEDPTSTVLVPKGWTAQRDANDNTILTKA